MDDVKMMMIIIMTTGGRRTAPGLQGECKK
jgi:hypothetical protein